MHSNVPTCLETTLGSREKMRTSTGFGVQIIGFRVYDFGLRVRLYTYEDAAVVQTWPSRPTIWSAHRNLALLFRVPGSGLGVAAPETIRTKKVCIAAIAPHHRATLIAAEDLRV